MLNDEEKYQLNSLFTEAVNREVSKRLEKLNIVVFDRKGNNKIIRKVFKSKFPADGEALLEMHVHTGETDNEDCYTYSSDKDLFIQENFYFKNNNVPKEIEQSNKLKYDGWVYVFDDKGKWIDVEFDI